MVKKFKLVDGYRFAKPSFIPHVPIDIEELNKVINKDNINKNYPLTEKEFFKDKRKRKS